MQVLIDFEPRAPSLGVNEVRHTYVSEKVRGSGLTGCNGCGQRAVGMLIDRD